LVQLAFHAAAASPVGGSVSAAAHAARAGDQALAQLAFDEAAEWYGVGLGLLVGHSRDAAQLKCRLLVSLGDAHDRAGEQVRARHSFLEAVAIARTIKDPALIAEAESALGRSPWPVPVHKPILSKIPVGTQNQHPFLMPEPPPVKLLPMGELLATSSAPDMPPVRPVRRSTPQVAAEQEMRAAAHRAAAAAAAAEAAAHPSKSKSASAPAPAATADPGPPASTKGKSRKAPPAAPAVAPVPITPPRPRRHPAAPTVAAAPTPAMADPYTPDDLSELWADPEPKSTPMGWSEAPWDDDDHTPASRNTTGRLSALRARHSRPWGPEDVDERLKASEQIVAIAEATDDGDLAMEGYVWRIADRMEMGRLSQADEDIAAFSNLANAIGDPIYRRDAAAYAVMRATLEGRWDDARSALLDVRALADRVGETKETPGGREQRYWMSLEWGSDEAVADIEATLKALPVGRAWAAQVALLLARTRRYDEALEWLGTISEHVVSARPFDGEWMQMAACALEAGALVRDPRLATILLPLIQPYADRVVVLAGGLVCLGSTARFAGLAAATCGDWELAERNFDLAVTVNRKLEAYPALAHSQAEWGWALLAQGRRADNKRAESLLVQARDLADELDMRRLAADIRVRRGGR
jgi:tetratricopeptide (TPR) repeat protein